MADTSASGGRRQSAETLGKHGGRQVARARMASLAAVKNPGAFLDGGLRPGPGSEPPVMDQSVPETAPEALHRRVAVTVILARHRRPQPELRHQSPVIVGTVPAAQAGVMDPPRGRAFKPHGPHQSQSRRLLRPPFAHGMAGDFAGEHVLDACQVEPALPGGQWSKRQGVVELFPCLSSPNRTCTSQRIRLSVQALLMAKATSA